MGRIKIYLQGFKNYRFDHDFESHLTYQFYEKINRLFAKSKFRNFYFYTFSKFVVEDAITNNDQGILSESGIVSVTVSSVNEVFLRTLVSRFVQGESLRLKNNTLKLIKIEILENPDFSSGKASLVTVTPIFLHNCVITGDLGDVLKNILIDKFCYYYNLDKCNYECEFYSKNEIFEDYMTYGEANFYYDYYYHVDIIMVAHPRLIRFAYDTGLGVKNNMGFGMLDLY